MAPEKIMAQLKMKNVVLTMIAPTPLTNAKTLNPRRNRAAVERFNEISSLIGQTHTETAQKVHRTRTETAQKLYPRGIFQCSGESPTTPATRLPRSATET
jgi:hypothetical protein